MSLPTASRIRGLVWGAVLRRKPSRVRGRPTVPPGLAPHTQASLIAHRAVLRGIRVNRLSRHQLELTFGKLSHQFRSGWSTLNTELALRCTHQKEITSRLLRHQGVSAPEGAVFRGDDLARAWAWAKPVLPVVVKPNAASKGTLVHVGVVDQEGFHAAFSSVADKCGTVLVEEYLEGDEHRFAVVDGRVIGVTERIPPRVTGDGERDVAALIALKNHQRSTRGNPLHGKPITVDDAVVATLQSQRLELSSVPDAGTTVWLRRTSNISLGGEAVDRADSVAPEHLRFVEKASAAIPGLRLAGFDVLLPRDNDGVPTVLEINPRPMLSMHVFPWEGQPREVYDPVLDAMFPETATVAGR